MRISENWQLNRLETLVKFSSGGTPSKANVNFWRGDIPWISAATMHQQEITTSNLHISDGLVKSNELLTC